MRPLQQSGLLGHSCLIILTLAATSAYNSCKVCALHHDQLCTYCAAVEWGHCRDLRLVDAQEKAVWVNLSS